MTVSTGQERETLTPPEQTASLRVGLYYLDVHGPRLYLLNETARQLHAEGLPALGTESSLHQMRTLTGDEVRAEDLPLQTAAREGRSVEVSFHLARPGRPLCQLLWSAAPFKDAAGSVTAVLGVVCCSAPEPDWHALAGLAHDLRTPMQVIRLLSTSMAQGTYPPERQADGLGRLCSAAERAMQIGDDLLEWCRTPLRGGRRVDPTWFHLEPFLTGVTQEHLTAAERKGVTLLCELGEAQGWEICTDRVRLGRVLANLLSNAVRYTAAGGRVRLSTGWRGKEDERALAVCVADTGVGIAPEEQESIFEPFARGHAGRGDSSSGGSGLGLAVVDRLVGDLGLRREFSSEYGRGSEFRVLLPMRLLRAGQGETIS
jgi:hypothetical protein